jgi:hypothetical protein
MQLVPLQHGGAGDADVFRRERERLLRGVKEAVGTHNLYKFTHS